MIFLTRLTAQRPAEGMGIRCAIYQGERPVGTPAALQDNLARLDEIVREAKKCDVQLISFPELYLEGYTLTPALLQQLAEPVDGPSIARVAAIAKAHHLSIICPYAERDDTGEAVRYYDAIAVLSAEGVLLHNYRKTHLFGQAERANYAFGYADGTEDPFCVSRVAGFPVGVLNCYEAEFPELSRILALRGARLIVMPTADYYYTLPDGRRTHVPYSDVIHTLRRFPGKILPPRCPPP